MRRCLICLLPIVALLLGACTGGGLPAPSPLFSSAVPSAQSPLPTGTPVVEVMPTGTPVVEEIVVQPNFKLDPLTAESTEATGQGPVGYTLVVIDSTSSARMLGTGRADANGNFRIPLGEQPRPGHRIGLTVDLTPEQYASEAVQRALYEARGPGYRLIPNLVTVYDSVDIPG